MKGGGGKEGRIKEESTVIESMAERMATESSISQIM